MSNENNRKRATSVAQQKEIFQKMMTPEEVSQGLAVKLSSTDIVITPFSKSGTTWLQQIVHCLRTRGDMDFDDISRVVPWIETSGSLGIDLNLPQRALPRAFKSHLGADAIPKGARYINSVRNPKDVAVSLFKFMEGWFVEPGSIKFDQFVRESFIPEISYWKHLLSWWQRRNDDDVLFLAYEHIKKDLPGTIKRVANFIDIELDDELQTITELHASFAFMKEHNDRFDDLLMRELSETRGGLPSGSDASKVRKGNIGDHKQMFTPELESELEQIWQQEITATTGIKDYDALIALLA